MKRLLLFCTLVLFTSILLIGCSNKENDTLTVGMELAYPPFETTDINGSPEGISIEMANSLAKYLGRPIKIENISYSGLIPSLTTKKVDIILSSMTITEDRKKTVDFSDPYCRAYLAVLANKNSDINSVADLNKKGKKVAVKKGTTGYFYTTKHLTDAEISVFDKESACVLEVTQGRADAFIYDQLTIYKNWKQYENTTKAILEPFDDLEYWGIALRKDDTKLKEQINAFIKDFETKKGFEKLSEKYLTDIKQEFDKRGLPFFFGSK